MEGAGAGCRVGNQYLKSFFFSKRGSEITVPGVKGMVAINQTPNPAARPLDWGVSQCTAMFHPVCHAIHRALWALSPSKMLFGTQPFSCVSYAAARHKYSISQVDAALGAALCSCTAPGSHCITTQPQGLQSWGGRSCSLQQPVLASHLSQPSTDSFPFHLDWPSRPTPAQGCQHRKQ